MNEQLTMEQVLNVALAMKQKGIDLSKIKVFLGNDDELNGIHNAWYCELITNNGQEDNDFIVDLINEDYNNNKVEKDEKFILIS